MGPVPWGGKPGYEDRKADLEAKLAEQLRRFSSAACPGAAAKRRTSVLAPAKTSDLAGFTPGRSSPIRGAPMGPVPWGGKPGYEDRKADLEAKLAE